jgi:hypothetical protein
MEETRSEGQNFSEVVAPQEEEEEEEECVISENEKCQSYVSTNDGIHHRGKRNAIY